MMKIIPGFAEVIAYEPRCALCQLTDSNPQLLKMVHAARKDGLSGRPLESKVQALFADGGISPSAGSDRALRRHFANHVDFAPVNGAIQRALEDHTHVDEEDVEMVDLESEYNEFWDILQNLKKEASAAHEQLKKAREKEENSDHRLIIWLKIIGEIRQALEAIGRIKNADKFARTHLRAMAKLSAGFLADSLSTRLSDAMGNDFDRVEPEIDEIIVRSMGTALLKTAERYRINLQ